MSRSRLLLLMLATAAGLLLAPAAAHAERTGSCLARGVQADCFVWTGKVTYLSDGDTFYVDLDGDRSRRAVPVRITGINAMEQSTYSRTAALRRGECHALEATARLEQLLRRSRWRVRLAAQDPASRAGRRLRRAVAVKHGKRWKDVGRILVREGHALWLPSGREWAWNHGYSVLADRAGWAQRNLWNPEACGAGPEPGRPMKLVVNWDADGDDRLDPNGEWVRVKNLDPLNAMPLGGWWLRDSGVRRFVFPPDAVVPAGGHLTLYVGTGDAFDGGYYWRRPSPQFENVTADERAMGDGAYLFDPEGDLRAWTTYPCRANCTDPSTGALSLDARAKGRELVRITNTGAVPIDLEPYRLVSKPFGYAFAPHSVLEPGETMRVRLYETFQEDSRLVRHWATNGPILNNGGDVVELRRFDDVRVACTAWGSRSC